MSAPKYDREKYYRIIDRSQSNYANLLKRLTKNSKRSDTILIYYSLFLIICSLSTKFYPDIFDENWMLFSSIILSTITLVFSIINGKANYQLRISRVQKALNDTKRLKRQIASITDNEKDALNKIEIEYDELVNANEVRDDVDFFVTVKHLCRKHGVRWLTMRTKRKYEEERMRSSAKEAAQDEVELSDIKGYLSELSPLWLTLREIALSVFYFIIFLIPAAVVVIGILIKAE